MGHSRSLFKCTFVVSAPSCRAPVGFMASEEEDGPREGAVGIRSGVSRGWRALAVWWGEEQQQEGLGAEMHREQQEAELLPEKQVEMGRVGRGGRLGSWNTKSDWRRGTGRSAWCQETAVRDCEGWKGEKQDKKCSQASPEGQLSLGYCSVGFNKISL